MSFGFVLVRVRVRTARSALWAKIKDILGSQSLVQTEACTQMGSRNCSGMGESSSGSLDRLRDFVVVHSSAGGNSSFELFSQSMEERSTSDRYHHFYDHSGMCA